MIIELPKGQLWTKPEQGMNTKQQHFNKTDSKQLRESESAELIQEHLLGKNTGVDW